MQLNVQDVAESCTCSIYGHIGTIYKFTDYQGVPDYSGKLTSTCKHMHFGAMTKCADYAGVLIFKYPA